jgi:transcriptional regulator with XRE-family HTH domain
MSTDHSAIVGQRITEHRTRMHLSQRQLSGLTGLSRSYLCDIEKGRTRNLPYDTAQTIAAALGTTAEAILAGRPVECVHPVLQNIHGYARCLVCGRPFHVTETQEPAR